MCLSSLVPLLISPITTAKMNFEKLLKADKFSKTHKFNHFQSSSSSSILAFFCIAVLLTPSFNVLAQLLSCFTQIDGSSLGQNFDKFRDAAPLIFLGIILM